MTVIDLGRERAKREGPDEDCIRRDDLGIPLYRYALSYRMDGKEWASEVWAYSWEDAENRAKAMRESMEVIGQTFAIVPA